MARRASIVTVVLVSGVHKLHFLLQLTRRIDGDTEARAAEDARAIAMVQRATTVTFDRAFVLDSGDPAKYFDANRLVVGTKDDANRVVAAA